MTESTSPHRAEVESLRILLVLPEAPWSKTLLEAFQRAGFLARAVLSVDSAILAAPHFRPEAIVVEASLLADDAYRRMESLRIAVPYLPILVLADGGDQSLRLKSLLMGAEDVLAFPLAHQEAVLRVRRAIERRSGIRRLADEKHESRRRADRFQEDMGVLRTQLLRNVALLQRGIDFHQRLDPDRGERELLTDALRNLSVQIGVDRLAYLARSRPDDAWFTAQAVWGLPDSLSEGLRAPAGGELLSLLESSGSAAVVEQLSRVPGLRLELGILSAGGFTAVIPVIHRAALLGVVLVGEMRGGGAPDPDTLRLGQFLVSALTPAVIAQRRREREGFISSHALGALVSRLEARDPYLRGHSLRVARIAEDLALRAGLAPGRISLLNAAATLHDVGRFEIDVTLWSKRAPLTSEDWDVIRRHPLEGERLAAEADWPEPVLAAIRSHHERWDGDGYPSGLRGEAIPVESRILAVADMYEALTSPRPQRPGLTPQAALEQIGAEAGRKLDPDLVRVFLAGSDILLVS
jgi:HD-GYP domain-containing protein (c-di-GMP phosphodiesterase class II)/DNA-binding response OmpR family regulator